MTYVLKPKFHHPNLPKNGLGFTHRDYEGSVSTFCAGCGHNSISSAIIQACFELDLPPHLLAKMSGIGSSSKTPTYFLSQSHLGATYVGRGFSGDKHQLVPLIKGAIEHRGIAFLDVISPCVAFKNHPGSTFQPLQPGQRFCNASDRVTALSRTRSRPSGRKPLSRRAPDADPFMLHLYAALAEKERR